MEIQKHLVSAGIVASLIISATQIWDWVTEIGGDVEGTFIYGAIQLPKAPFERHEELEWEHNNKDLKMVQDLALDISKILGKEENLKEPNPEVLNVLSTHIAKIASKTGVRDLKRIKGYWKGSITNSSSSTLNDLTLNLPDAIAVVISKEASQPITRNVKSKIEIGKLAPAEEVQIYAWTGNEIHSFDADKVKLVHAQGIGEIEILSPVRPFWHWMSRWFWLPLCVLAWIASIAVQVTLDARKKSRNT